MAKKIYFLAALLGFLVLAGINLTFGWGLDSSKDRLPRSTCFDTPRGQVIFDSDGIVYYKGNGIARYRLEAGDATRGPDALQLSETNGLVAGLGLDVTRLWYIRDAKLEYAIINVEVYQVASRCLGFS